MGCVWPMDAKQIFEENRVVLVRPQKPLAISTVGGGLVACKEASSNPCAAGAECQNCSKAAPIRYTASGNHRRRRNRIHDGRAISSRPLIIAQAKRRRMYSVMISSRRVCGPLLPLRVSLQV